MANTLSMQAFSEVLIDIDTALQQRTYYCLSACWWNHHHFTSNPFLWDSVFALVVLPGQVTVLCHRTVLVGGSIHNQ